MVNVNTWLRNHPVTSGRGADMGRSAVCNNPTARVVVQKVLMVDGGYDLGGAYWGSTRESQKLWAAMDNESQVQLYFRAVARRFAIEMLHKLHPNLKVIDDPPPIDLEAFVDNYLECAIASSDEDDRISELSIAKVSPELRRQATEDCGKFIEQAGEWIQQCPMRAVLEEQGGYDFWLTRNRHGAGFWDGDWPEEVEDLLTEAANQFTEIHLYLGDDGLIYAE